MLVKLGYWFLEIIYLTQRWKIFSETKLEKHWFDDSPYILAFWHNRQLAMPLIYKKYSEKGRNNLYVLISPHKDGRLIANIVENFGIKSIAGSSSRRSVEASRVLVKLLNDGKSIVITPDGPRGPNQKAKDGIINIANITNVPIVPMSFACDRAKIFSSWDKMILPLPFAKGVIYIGKPLNNPTNHELELALNQAEIEASNLL